MAEEYKDHVDCLDEVLFENENKGIQYRLTVSEFRDTMYLGIREWYVDFEGEYSPSSNGVTLPYNLHTTARLYNALGQILSRAEVLDEVKKYEQSS